MAPSGPGQELQLTAEEYLGASTDAFGDIEGRLNVRYPDIILRDCEPYGRCVADEDRAGAVPSSTLDQSVSRAVWPLDP